MFKTGGFTGYPDKFGIIIDDVKVLLKDDIFSMVEITVVDVVMAVNLPISGA